MHMSYYLPVFILLVLELVIHLSYCSIVFVECYVPWATSIILVTNTPMVHVHVMLEHEVHMYHFGASSSAWDVVPW